MTQFVLALTDEIVSIAFASVNNKVSNAKSEDLQSIGDATKAVVERVWTRIEDLVNECFCQGWEHCKDKVSNVLDYATEESMKLGLKVIEFRKQLLDQLRQVIMETFDLVLAAVRSEIRVGETVLHLNSIDLEHKLVFSSSLEASVTALCKFVGSGEVIVSGSYLVRT